jgi:WD40 repeat protein
MVVDGLWQFNGPLQEDRRHVQIWDTKTARLLTTLVASDKITHLAFSADATMLVTAAEDGTAQVWTIPSGGAIRTFDAQQRLWWASFIAGRSAIAAVAGRERQDGYMDGEVFVWDLHTGQRLSSFRLRPEFQLPLCADALTPDGRLLITAGAVYDLLSGARIAPILDQGVHNVEELDVSQDGNMVAILEYPAFQKYIVRIWRIERE